MLPPPVAGRALPPEAVLLTLLPTITATAMTIVARATKSLKGGVLALRCAFAMQPLVHDPLQAEVVHVEGAGGKLVAELFEQVCKAAYSCIPIPMAATQRVPFDNGVVLRLRLACRTRSCYPPPWLCRQWPATLKPTRCCIRLLSSTKQQ